MADSGSSNTDAGKRIAPFTEATLTSITEFKETFELAANVAGVSALASRVRWHGKSTKPRWVTMISMELGPSGKPGKMRSRYMDPRTRLDRDSPSKITHRICNTFVSP
jgi:hypothetical protein